MRRTVVMAGSLMIAVSPLRAEETLQRFSWRDLQDRGELNTGAIEGPGDWLAIENTQSSPISVAVFTIESPVMTKDRFAVVGEVSHEGVSGDGYLEMNAHFDRGTFFSRTLAPSGELGVLSGTSGPRPFRLPFHVSDGSHDRPKRLDIRVVLPGVGKVRLGPLRLVQYDDASDASGARSNAWWSASGGGVLGGFLGGGLGLLGALVGTLAGLGRARKVVMSLVGVMMLVGAGALMAGILALLGSQPYWVYYPCLLLGVLSTALPGTLWPTLRRRYREMELRKMTSLDVA